MRQRIIKEQSPTSFSSNNINKARTSVRAFSLSVKHRAVFYNINRYIDCHTGRKGFIMKKLNKKGFTLIELVVVIAILGIFSSMLIPTFINMSREARIEEDNIKFESICTALKSSLSQPEVQNEMEDLFNNEEFLVVFTSNADTGDMNLMNGQAAKDNTAVHSLKDMELGKNAWPLMDRAYTVQDKDSYGFQLTIKCTPKTSTTTAKAVIVSWEDPNGGT